MTPPTDPAALLRLEAASMAAWPGLQTVKDGPWVVRFGDGYTGRANSISIFAPATDMAERLERGSALLEAQGLAAVVRLGSMAQPDLTPVLDAAGFGPAHHSVATLWRRLEPNPLDPAVEITPTPTAAWLAAKDSFHDEDADTCAARRRMLAAITAPVGFGLLRDGDGKPAALAYVAIHDGIASLNKVAAAPARRGQRLAERVCEGLLAWAAAEHGAWEACLQVAEDNAPALKLYARMGFSSPLYTYHYRKRPPDAPGWRGMS